MKANKITGTRPRLLTESSYIPFGEALALRRRNIYATIDGPDEPYSTLLPSGVRPAFDINEVAAAQEWLETVSAEDESEDESEDEFETEIAIFGNAVLSVFFQ